MTKTKPCTQKWPDGERRCVALAVDGGETCVVHKRVPNLRPVVFKRNVPKVTWPRTPWDSEVPWYERDHA